MSFKSKIDFWRKAITYQINRPKGKLFYFVLGFAFCHGIYNLINLGKLI